MKQDSKGGDKVVMRHPNVPQVFKTKRALVFMGVSAVVGVMIVIATFAYSPVNGDFEGESMTVESLQ